MSVFLYGNYGTTAANASLGRASQEVANSAARLSSGSRVISGKAGGADVATADKLKAASYEAASLARTATYELGIRTRDAAVLDTIASLLIQGAELEKAKLESGADSAAYAAQINALVTRANEFRLEASDSLALDAIDASTAFTTQLDAYNIKRGTVAGEAAGYELEAAARSASANAQREIAQNYLAVDYGAETANLTRYQILQQAATAMLAQANQSSNVILALFR